MKIQIISDVHVPVWHDRHSSDWFQKIFVPNISYGGPADLLVIAGDFYSLTDDQLRKTRDRLSELAQVFGSIIYVPGNHEFWCTSIVNGLQNLYRLEREVPRLQVLMEGRTLEVDGQRFLGGTMWQPHSGSLWAASRKAFIDGSMISDFWTEAPARFDLLMSHLKTNCRPEDVVITHHAPSMNSLDSLWVGHPDNRFFLTPEAEAVIHGQKPRLWIHGHVHSHWDYRLGQTRVVANPVGYPGEGVAFDPQLIVEL